MKLFIIQIQIKHTIGKLPWCPSYTIHSKIEECFNYYNSNKVNYVIHYALCCCGAHIRHIDPLGIPRGLAKETIVGSRFPVYLRHL